MPGIPGQDGLQFKSKIIRKINIPQPQIFTVYFDNDKFLLSKKEETQFIQNLNRQKLLDYKISINCFADVNGSELANQHLSEKRCEEIKKIIQDQNSSSLIQTNSYGEIYSTQSSSHIELQKDRRVDIHLNPIILANK